MCNESIINYFSGVDTKKKKTKTCHHYVENLERRFTAFKIRVDSESGVLYNEGVIALNLMLIEATSLARRSLKFASLKNEILDYKTYFMMVLHNQMPETLTV